MGAWLANGGKTEGGKELGEGRFRGGTKEIWPGGGKKEALGFFGGERKWRGFWVEPCWTKKKGGEKHLVL